MAYLSYFIRIILLLFFVVFVSRNSYGTSFLSSNKKNTFLSRSIVNLKGKKTFAVPCKCVFCIICLSSRLLTAFISTLVDLDLSFERRYWSPVPRLPDGLVLVFAMMFPCVVSLVLITTSMGWYGHFLPSEVLACYTTVDYYQTGYYEVYLKGLLSLRWYCSTWFDPLYSLWNQMGE